MLRVLKELPDFIPGHFRGLKYLSNVYCPKDLKRTPGRATWDEKVYNKFDLFRSSIKESDLHNVVLVCKKS